ncbi:hypothetical protein F9L33_09595 [Amylibacter sp. SFDW26]|uniref:hypothetical protein n=1 Tax=Amylibacter sp. SFDW26 TaxID=2652722 RepID=UPI0012623F8A|nr:hypothetical protein [Amylibacter sp. SFDW26]KAB7613623.1 hypothetical protein F9L33_09595 [Amylibacter sp. SFDW26]
MKHSENVLGNFCFVQFKGLKLEGDGYASGLSASPVGPLEFRDSKGVGYLPVNSSPSLFLRRVSVNGKIALLCGFINRINIEGRAGGTIGAGQLCMSENLETLFLPDHTLDFYEEFHEYVSCNLSESREIENIGYLSPDRSKMYDIEAVHQGRSFVVNPPEKGDNLLRLSIEMLDTISDKFDTIIIGMKSDNRYSQLSYDLISTLQFEKNNSDRLHPNELESEFLEYTSESLRRFEKREPHLKYPRPAETNPEAEDYIIALIDFYLSNKFPDLYKSREQKSSKVVNKAGDFIEGSIFKKNPFKGKW